MTSLTDDHLMKHYGRESKEMRTAEVVEISVTQECINKGRCKNVLCCPIALAVNGGDTVIGSTVGKQTVTIVYQDKFITYALPQNACDFVDKFDTHETGEPFKFCLDIILSQGTEEELWHKKRRVENVGK